MSGKERCLLIDFHHLGDAVMAFPAIRGLGRKYDVFVACRPEAASVFELIVPQDRILSVDARWAGPSEDRSNQPLDWLHWIGRTAREWRELGFAASFSGWCDPRVDLLACRAGIAHRAGLPVAGINYYVWRAFRLPSKLGAMKVFQMAATVLAGKKLLTHPISRPDWFQHHREDWAQVIATAGVEADDSLPWFPVPEVPVPRSGWVCHSGSEQVIKQWPVQKWKELHAALEARLHAPVRVIRGPGESLEGWGLPGDRIVDSDSIPRLVEILAGAEGLVCLDSFPAHLAAAMGTPAVTLFGSQDPRWFSPFQMEGGIVKGQEGAEPNERFLEEVSVDHVMEVFENRLSSNRDCGE